MAYQYKKPSAADSAAPALISLGGASPLHPMMSALSLSREARSTDLDTAASSGYGHKDEIVHCPEGIPIKQALFGLLAAFAASFGFLFRAVTQAQGGRRRKRMAEDGLVIDAETSVVDQISFMASDLFWSGTFGALPLNCPFHNNLLANVCLFLANEGKRNTCEYRGRKPE